MIWSAKWHDSFQAWLSVSKSLEASGDADAHGMGGVVILLGCDAVLLLGSVLVSFMGLGWYLESFRAPERMLGISGLSERTG